MFGKPWSAVIPYKMHYWIEHMTKGVIGSGKTQNRYSNLGEDVIFTMAIHHNYDRV